MYQKNKIQLESCKMAEQNQNPVKDIEGRDHHRF